MAKINPRVLELLKEFSPVSGSTKTIAPFSRGARSFREAIQAAGIRPKKGMTDYSLAQRVVEDIQSGMKPRDLIAKHGIKQIDAVNRLLGMSSNLEDNMFEILRDAANPSRTRANLVKNYGKEAVENLETRLGVQYTNETKDAFKKAAREAKNATKGAESIGVRRSAKRSRDYVLGKNDAKTSRAATREARRAAARKTVATRPNIPGMFDPARKLGKMAKFGRFAGPIGLGALGVYELYNIIQGMDDDVNTSQEMMQMEDMFSGLDGENRELARSESQGFQDVANTLEMEDSIYQPGPQPSGELGALMNGYEDMLESTKGETRPSLEQAYARMGLL